VLQVGTRGGIAGMTLVLETPDAGRLREVLEVLRGWQRDDAPIQLHPGDIGWAAALGVDAAAAAVRTWSRGDEVVAIGFLDGPTVLRMTVSPSAWSDRDVAEQVVVDLDDPDRGVFAAGTASVEAPDGTGVRAALDDAGWELGDPWAPLRLDLADAVPPVALHTDLVGPEQVPEFTSVHRAAWGSERFTDERWHAMASGPAHADALCLLGRDEDGTPVAGVTVWSAGPGRPALLEPLGVHPDHRRRGHGRAVCLAAAAALRERGCSSLLVCTEGDRVSAIQTYLAAGFEALPQRLDRTRRELAAP
jgi:GNAT superfamily N-acetyltransferase